jgi:hypothetical protein
MGTFQTAVSVLKGDGVPWRGLRICFADSDKWPRMIAQHEAVAVSQEADRVLIEALQAEVNALRTSAESLLFSFERLFNLVLVFVVGGLGVAWTQNNVVLLAIVPVPVVILGSQMLSLNIEGLSRAGHKRWLEEQLSSMIGTSYVEERFVAPTRQGRHWFGRPGIALFQGLLMGTLFGVLAIGLAGVIKEMPRFVVVYVVFIALVVAIFVFEYIALRTAYQKAYNAARLAWQGQAPPEEGGQLPTPPSTVTPRSRTGQ